MKKDMYVILNRLSELVKYDSKYNLENVLNKLCINYIDNLLESEYELTSEESNKLLSLINCIKYYG